jgi:excisionase family DNA binding protein
MATPGIFKLQGLMTTSEAAKTIGVHRNTIWNAINQGHIPSNKIGNAIALDPKDVADFRARYLRGEITSTAPAPKKKGRPLKVVDLGEVCSCPACGGETRKLTCELAAPAQQA